MRWNAEGGNFTAFRVSNWLYRRDGLRGRRCCFHEKTKNSHNNQWGHVHAKLLLSVFQSDAQNAGETMAWEQSAGDTRELLRVSVLTHGPFGGPITKGTIEYSAWYSQDFPISTFGHFTKSNFGTHLKDFICKMVEGADKEHFDNPESWNEPVHCQCGNAKYEDACRPETDDGRPSSSEPVKELLQAVTHADCRKADKAGFLIVSSVIGCTNPLVDTVKYGHQRVNDIASKYWGSDGAKVPKPPADEDETAVAPAYHQLMTEEERDSELSLAIIVHNIAAGCTPTFLRNFEAAWKIPKPEGVKVLWPGSANLVGDADNPKIEFLTVPFYKGFCETYLADTYSANQETTIKGCGHAVFPGMFPGSETGTNHLWKYLPRKLAPTPRRFGRWTKWKSDTADPEGFAPPGAAQDDEEVPLPDAAAPAPQEQDKPIEEQQHEDLPDEDHDRKIIEEQDREEAQASWRRSKGIVAGEPTLNPFDAAQLQDWVQRAAVGQSLEVQGLDRPLRNRVRDVIRAHDDLSTVLTTEGLGFGDERTLRITKQDAAERCWAHHFQQYCVLDRDNNPKAFLLTSANLSSFAWGDQSSLGQELPSFGLVPDRKKRGEGDEYCADTPSHGFWMRNYEFGVMDVKPWNRRSAAACTPEPSAGPPSHGLPIAVDLQHLQRFEDYEEPWTTAAHERLCGRVNELHMRKLQEQLLAFAHPKNLGKIYPMDVSLTLAERSQIRMICREINIPDYDRPIPPWLKETRKPTNEDKVGGQTRVRAGKMKRFSPQLWLDLYIREAPRTMYGTQLVVFLTTKQDYVSRRPRNWNRGAFDEVDDQGRRVNDHGSQLRD